ncbi:MAG: hypothetical protein Q4G02_01805 [bacterium]|nr:hypothetical protein [bacterium]
MERKSLRPRYQKNSVAEIRPTRKLRQTNPGEWSQTLFWLVAVAILLAAIYFFSQKVFVVQRVYCTINNSSTPCSQSLQEAAQKMIGQPLLFQDYANNFRSLAEQHLYIKDLSYHKVLPGTLFLNFNFPSALYQLILPDGQTMNFATNGQFTLTPATEQTLKIKVNYEPALVELTNYQLDLVLQQKLEFLEYFSRDLRDNWEEVNFIDLNTLQIVIDGRTYVLDLFSLDDNLQKLAYLKQANWVPDDDITNIDLRFRLPIVK